jgi:hypothetical protein
MKKVKTSSKKTPSPAELDYYQAARLQDRWAFFYQSHIAKDFYGYTSDGKNYYAYKNGVWMKVGKNAFTAVAKKNGKPFRYSPSVLSYEAFLARAPLGPYPGLNEDPDALVGDLDIQNPTLAKTILFMNWIHRNQKDRGHMPYAYHPLWVAEHVSKKAQKVALMHDAIEDCGVNDTQLAAAGLTPKEIEAVKALTRQGDEGTLEGYFAYVEGIRNTNPLAYEVKQADLLMNLDLRRLPTVGVLDVERALKYEAALFEKENDYLQARSLLEGAVQSRARFFFTINALPKKESDCPAFAQAFKKAVIPEYGQALGLYRPYLALAHTLEKETPALVKEYSFADLLLLHAPESWKPMKLRAHVTGNKVITNALKDAAKTIKAKAKEPQSDLEFWTLLKKAIH